MRIHIAGLFAALSTLTLAAQDEPDLFTKLDTNKDGFVTADEVPEANKTLFERLLRNADKNSDSKLSKDEFQAGLKPAEGPRPPLDGGAGRPGQPGNPGARPDPRQAEQMFAQADRNNDGKLTKDEIPEDRRERFGQMLERLNPGGDSLTKEQFVRGMMFQAQGNPPPAPGTRPNPAGPPTPQVFEALFDRTDSNSDGKLTKDEIPEERQGMRMILDRSGGESISKEQFVRGMMAMAPNAGQPPRPEGAPARRPDGAPGGPPPGGLFAALDTDRDGQLSNAEIVGAGSALLKLDRNNDGKLTPEEVFAGGPGGPPGRPGDARPGEPRRPGDGQPPGERRPGQRGPGNQSPEEFLSRLKQADTNNDGKLSKDEAPPFLKERFERLDANSDGFLDQEESRRLLDQRPRDGNPPNRRPNTDQPRRPDSDKK